VIDLAKRSIAGVPVEPITWARAPYRPTPTIIEAARALYAQHSVEVIARFDAGAENLRVTSSRIDELVDEAMVERRKMICFVTGVPGAGKTLVGGGQEISTGEAGIGAWLEAVQSKLPHWELRISSRLTDAEYVAGRALEIARQQKNAHFDDCLHLSVSLRSFRAENVSAFVKALLDCEGVAARDCLTRFLPRYPVVLTRDLNRAKAWVRQHARGSERYGLVASSKAQRLKPHAIDIRVDVDPVQWFLNDRDDTRSSFYLEDAATEFQVQGMVIFVPPGDHHDPTRSPQYYDATFEYLREVGIPVING
jgi:hypothetical protein